MIPVEVVSDRIGPTFAKLSEQRDRDRSRPGIELYRRGDVIDLQRDCV